MDLSNHLTQIILAIVALFAGITITVKIIRNKNTKINSGMDNSNNVTISNNKTKGDIAGRDITKTDER